MAGLSGEAIPVVRIRMAWGKFLPHGLPLGLRGGGEGSVSGFVVTLMTRRWPRDMFSISPWNGFVSSGRIDGEMVMVGVEAFDPGGQEVAHVFWLAGKLLPIRGGGPNLGMKLLMPRMIEGIKDNLQVVYMPEASLELDGVGAELPGPIMG